MSGANPQVSGRQRTLSYLIDGESRPTHGRILHSSTATPWAGGLLERKIGHPGRESRLTWPSDRIVYVMRGSLEITDTSIRRQPSYRAALGSITLMPAGHEARDVTWSGPAEVIDLELLPESIRAFAPVDFDAGNLRLTMQLGIFDPQLASLIDAMDSEIRTGCGSGRLYGESLSLASLAYVSRRYGAGLPSGSAASHATPGRRHLTKALDFIHANLDREIGLAEIAGVACLSPRQLVRAFRTSLGSSPYQYLLVQRIETAKRCLAAGGSIGEAITASGFASQSHFTTTFKRLVGSTPGTYRRQSSPSR